MGCPGGCWFFKECLTYSASGFLSRHGLPFPANLFCICAPSPNTLSGERFGCFDASVAFSLGPFSTDIVPYPFCNTHRAWKFFVFILTKQVPYAIHDPSNWLLRMWWSSIYTSATTSSDDECSHLPSGMLSNAVDSETTNRKYQNNPLLIIQRF